MNDGAAFLQRDVPATPAAPISPVGAPLPAVIHCRRTEPQRPGGGRAAGGKQFGSFDGLDNRRDFYRLLQRLDRLSEGVAPEVGCARRREFLAWCCTVVAKNSGMGAAVGPQTVGFTWEIYRDVCALASIPGWLDITIVACELERWVKRIGR